MASLSHEAFARLALFLGLKLASPNPIPQARMDSASRPRSPLSMEYPGLHDEPLTARPSAVEACRAADGSTSEPYAWPNNPDLSGAIEELAAKRRAACRTLENMGYVWNGGAYWKPPLGKPPAYVLDNSPNVVNLTDLSERYKGFNGQ